MSSPTRAATYLVFDDSRFLSKLCPCVLDTHAAAILAKLNSGIYMHYYSIEHDLLWFQTKRELSRLYASVSRRTEVLREVHDHALVGHGAVNTIVEEAFRFFRWPGVQAAVKDYQPTGPNCQQLKPRNPVKPGSLHVFLPENGSG